MFRVSACLRVGVRVRASAYVRLRVRIRIRLCVTFHNGLTRLYFVCVRAQRIWQANPELKRRYPMD